MRCANAGNNTQPFIFAEGSELYLLLDVLMIDKWCDIYLSISGTSPPISKYMSLAQMLYNMYLTLLMLAYGGFGLNNEGLSIDWLASKPTSEHMSTRNTH